MMPLPDNFLLSCAAAERLYFEHAATLPIIDFHCHLPSLQIAEDHQFADLGELWLEGDHYKWRAMRTAGIPEHFITGEAGNKEKFLKFAEIMPLIIRNPLYTWTQMELRNPFEIHEPLNANSAEDIWKATKEYLKSPNFSARGLIRHFGVEVICTTDDPVDDLSSHRSIAEDMTFRTRVYPTFRPDKLLVLNDAGDWNRYVDKLSAAARIDIDSFDSLMAGLEARMQFFHDHGCRLSDHGLEFLETSDTDRGLDKVVDLLRSGKDVRAQDWKSLRAHLLRELGRLYHCFGWTQQFHLGALRNVNTRWLRQLGPDAGFDTIADALPIRPVAEFLDELDRTEELAKTILYNLDPNQYEAFAALIGAFQGGRVSGRVQLGSAWWFNDQREGICRQLNAISNMGLLSHFVGMVTDSRSFLSYSRHDYFRRILCDLLGTEMEAGLVPRDDTLVGEIVRRVCYTNACSYFQFPKG